MSQENWSEEGGISVPEAIWDESDFNFDISGSGSTGTPSQEFVSQLNPNSTKPQSGAGSSTTSTEFGNGSISGSNGINSNNEPNQTGDEFLPIINPNAPDGSGLGNTPSSGFGPAAGESGNQIISDTSGKSR